MKKIVSILLLLALLCGLAFSVNAVSEQDRRTADALYSLNLFLGYGNDEDGNPNYGLNDSLTREQGLLLLLRMLGKADAAKQYTGKHPFKDVSAYYDCYVAYAYNTGLTKGTGASTFEGTTPMNQKMFATFCLRTLGYQDGTSGDFKYDDALTFAAGKGFDMADSGAFTRADTVSLFWQTLNMKLKNSELTLADRLISLGVFSAEEFAKAKEIYAGTAEPTKPASDEGSSGTGGSGGGGGSGSGGGESGSGGGESGSGGGSKTCQHSYIATVVPPTCREQGYTSHVCSKCGDCYKDTFTGPHQYDKDDCCIICGYNKYTMPVIPLT